ncbi:hypothetical protein B0H16DRAFT_1027978 [Mycena metata]|uniref:Uncharacterized protein n=1 Tax=Mycena metata TaxID=1033252 RepID=A0AAD7N1P8_9AGAR|nr:hypothetical protein B0H16DRAFT_1027978 [Mycena metata]
MGFLPWSQLTSLTLVGKGQRECMEVLVNVPNLVYCELVSWGDLADYPDVRLPRLETLVLVHLELVGYPWDIDYLAPFTTPALRRLQLPDTYLGLDPIGCLASFVSRSACTIQELCITGQRTVPKTAYRRAFPTSAVSFNTKLVDWESDKADRIRRDGRISIAAFESSWNTRRPGQA